MYSCLFCITHKDLLDLSSSALLAYKGTYTSVVADNTASRVVQGGFTGLTGSIRRSGRGGGRGRGSRNGNDNSKPPITHLGPRSNKMQMRLAHLEACECCPGDKCWKTIHPDDEGELVGEADT